MPYTGGWRKSTLIQIECESTVNYFDQRIKYLKNICEYHIVREKLDDESETLI